MKNILTIDLEDWRQLVRWKMTGVQTSPSPRVLEETETLLELLSERGITATFFVLSNVAKTYPELVRRVDAAGHEVASHGWSHSLIYRQTPGEFRAETRNAKQLLENILGKPIYGYRAAEFSITRQSLWALDILAEEGFTFDSSIYPIAGKRYGIPDFPLAPCLVKTENGCLITEFPLTAVELGGRRLPVGGGSNFGLLPYSLSREAIGKLNGAGRPAVAYFHPYEFSAGWLSVPLTGRLARRAFMFLRYFLIHNLARARVRTRFCQLLRDFEFVPIREIIPSVSTNPTIL